ncbi:RecF/RecN/SMC N terminal domain-containing protein [Ephemerocybe angulata]|uniref:Structural maintenance of chromosomes protein 4 n=1 Tax=Ephemerocybe angulata TaxID=980116 RepID=A0A8H6HL39_9AGAR|nr:RecF/RecN/SMC N terminal domain-containing protein [Tulosesus angulatus]
MPPRRSSRAPSATPAASQAAESAPAKRKRSQVAHDDDDQTDAKPASRARRASSSKPASKAAPKGRASTRSKTSLPDVQESEDEAESDAPPVRKRSRPSVESDLNGGEEEEEEEEVSAPKRRGGRKPKQVVVKEEEEEEEPPAALPKRRSSRQPSAGPSRRPSGASSSRSTRKARVPSIAASVPEQEEDEEEEEEQPEPPKKRGGRAPAKQVTVSDDDEDELAQPSEEEEDSDVPKPKGRKGKAAAPRATKASKKAPKKVVVVETDSEKDDDEDSDSPPPPPRSSPKKVSASPVKPSYVQPTEEEEEKSLFDPIPASQPAPVPQAVPEEPEGPKPRLVIHKLALVNFKSYAGRQEIGPFHKSFSAIVGPNGSGKSNTIDALLFVFGYRASKMRQGKVSELIHNSARHPDLQECSVEVHFRDILDLPGADAFEIIPGSKLVVSRTAYTDNSSKYSINGKKSSYKEVQALLKGRGIDLDHNRFLILQGEVESIAQMKPKAPTEHEDGLLEYLEDIIGTTQYKKPIEEALAAFEELQEDRQVKLNRLRLVEKEKEALEEQRREAINYYKMKNDHVRAQSRYYQWLLWKGIEQLEKAEAAHAKLEQDLEAETEKNQDNLKHYEKLQAHYAGKEQNFELVRVATEKAVKDLKETEKMVVGLKEKQKHADGRAKKLKKSVTEDTAALKKAEHDINDANESLEKNKRELEAHEESLEVEEKKLEGIQESLTGKTRVFHDKIQVKQKELQPWTAKIDAKQAEIDVRVSERDTLAKRAEDRKNQLDEAEKAFEELETLQKDQTAQHTGFKTKKEQLKRDVADAQQRFENAKKDVDDLKAKSSSLRGRLDDARASQAANRSQGTVVNKLQSLKEQGRIQGFHGKLGALGAIDAKYDVAISTACGGQLANLVVETVGEGKFCIEHLRTNNLGRASFMVLEKIQEYPDRMKTFDTPEGCPRLFDLVKPKNPIYRKAFYKAIGDTLVAKDLDQANRIAYGARRFRVVTLTGQIIETSGAMSGGGGQPSRGAMSAKQAQDGVSPDTLRTWEVDATKAAEALSRAIQELRDAENELDRLKRMGPELEISYQKLGMEIETRKSRILELGKRVKDLRAQNKPDATDLARIKQLQREIDAATTMLEELQENADAINKDISDLEEQIMKIGGAKLMTQKSRVDGIRTHIALANEFITKAEVAKSKAENDVKRLTASIATNTANLEEVKQELEVLNEEVVQHVEYRDKLKGEVETAQVELENQKDTLDELKEGLDEAEAEIAGFRKKEMELNQKIADLEKDIGTYEIHVNKYKSQHDGLRLIDIEEDDDDDSDDEDEANKPEGSTAEGDEQEQDIKPDPEEAAPSKPKKDLELKSYSTAELKGFKQNELVADTELLDERIKNAKVDLTVLKEYKKREAEFDNRAKDVERVTEAKDQAKAHYDGLGKKRLEEFMDGFTKISLKLKEMYQMITLGGNAELELVDSMDPFAEGIIFSVMPPKKSWKNISNLSGGEKTLSSLALVFALHVYKPTPLYFMDEIDAALDFRNVSIVANYIKDRTKNAQFIIISLRNDMFELSHRLIGIYKTANATRSISINNHKLLSTVPTAVPVPLQPSQAAA